MNVDEYIATDLNDEAGLSEFSLLYIRKYVYENNWHSNIHSHNHTEFFFVVNGRGTIQFEVNSCEIKPGDFLIINHHVSHTEISSKDFPLTYIVLGIRGLEAFYGENEKSEYFKFNNAESSKNILNVLNLMLYESEKGKENHKKICEYLLKSLLLFLMRETQLINSTPDDEKTSKECAAVKRYIDAHHKENLTLESLADYAHISKYYMVHSFKKKYGVAPMHYLQSKRILESKRLLTETNFSSAQIAQILGFSSASHFSQCFKRLTDVSPSQFRSLNRQEENEEEFID